MHNQSAAKGEAPDSIRMLGRAIAIIEQIATTPDPMGVSHLARRTGIPKTSVHRLLTVLASHDLVAPGSDGFVLGPAMRSLIELVHDRSGEDLRHLMMPYLVELHQRTGDVVMLGVLDQDVVVVLETVYGHHNAASAPPVHQLPADRSAMGILLLRHRRQPPAYPDPFAICHQECRPGLTDVAIPLVGRAGVVAALGRVRPSADPGAGNTDVHRQIAIAASAALRSHP